MILQRSDCLVFETASGECIPCSAEELTIELIGNGSKAMTPELVQNAASALLHYFKHDLGKEKVTIGEFTEALVDLLRRLGYEVTESGAVVEEKTAFVELSLENVLQGLGASLEIAFFNRLRTEVHNRLHEGTQGLRVVGLRSCVKQLSGARRWNGRCRELSDQIVQFLRECLSAEPQLKRCELIVI